MNLLKNSLKPTKPFYQILLAKTSSQNIKAMSKWQADLNLEINENWNQHFKRLYLTTDDTKLLSLQYKLLHRIIYTNSRLFKCQLTETELCTFCSEQKESLLHLFYDCSFVKTFILQLREEIALKCNINFVLAPDIWILNKFIGTPIETDCLSICAVLAKYFIYCCKVKDCLPNIMSFKQKLKSYKSVELYSKFMYSEKKAEKITVRWSVLGPLLE